MQLGQKGQRQANGMSSAVQNITSQAINEPHEETKSKADYSLLSA